MSGYMAQYCYLLHCGIVKRMPVRIIRTQIDYLGSIFPTGLFLDASPHSGTDSSKISFVRDTTNEQLVESYLPSISFGSYFA